MPAYVLVLVALGLVLTVLATWFPPTGDDLKWGTQSGLDRLHHHFAGYNGRYLGNLAVLALTRTPVAPLVVAVTVCLIVGLLTQLTGQRDVTGVLVAAALVIAMPLGQWRQTVVWLSGFTNYALAALFLLLFAVSVRRDWNGARLTPPRAVVLLVVAVAATLFSENLTVFLVVASLAHVALRALRKDLRVTLRSVVWLVGSLVGAVVMFSNSAYWNSEHGTRYQSVGASGTGATGLRAVLIQGTHGVSHLAVADNTVLNGTLFVLLLCLASALRSRTGRLDRGPAAAVALAGVAVVLSAGISADVPPGQYFGPLTRWAWLPALALLASILLGARFLVADRVRAWLVVALGLSAVVLVAPMAAVTPYGPRTFLVSYVLMVAIALVLLAELRETSATPELGHLAAAVAAAVVIVVLGGYLTVYRAVDHASQARIEAARRAVAHGSSHVTVPSLPFPDYVYHPEPGSAEGMRRFLEYYGLPADLVVDFAGSSRGAR